MEGKYEEVESEPKQKAKNPIQRAKLLRLAHPVEKGMIPIANKIEPHSIHLARQDFDSYVRFYLLHVGPRGHFKAGMPSLYEFLQSKFSEGYFYSPITKRWKKLKYRNRRKLVMKDRETRAVRMG